MPNILRQFGKNILTGGASLAVRMVLVFLVTPLLIHTLGNDLYGVWVLIFSIINYMTICDFGLQQALVRFISKFLGLNDYQKINSVLNTAFSVYALVGMLVIAMAGILSLFVMEKFHIPAQYLTDGRTALFIIGLNTALNLILFSWGGSLGAFHRYDIANGIAIVEDIVRTIAIVVMLKSGYSIVALSLVFLIFSFFRLTTAAVFLKKLHPAIRLNFRLINRETLRMLYGYSSISFLISVAWLFIASTDNVIIGYFLDTASIAKYAIAIGFVVALRSLIHTVTIPLQPLISHYDTIKAKDTITSIYTKATTYLYFLTFAVAGGTLIFADPMIKLWIGSGYESSATLLKILIVPAAIYLPSAIGEAILYGIERHKNFLHIILVEGVLNLSLSLLLVQKYGMYGVAYGTIMAQVIVYLFIMPWILRPILGFALIPYYFSIMKATILAFGASISLSYLCRLILSPVKWRYFFVEIIAVALLIVLLGYFLIDKEDLRRKGFIRAKGYES
ncbi:MAG: oligosaccharide flippase family protein [candidate division Zixibacteria bacterium]|nr:oligosaccharide flippase family protein [candidate division Zixibacteria bacterium]